MIPLYIIEDFFFSVSRAVKIFGLIKRKVEFVLCVRFCLVAICVSTYCDLEECRPRRRDLYDSEHICCMIG
jgi:hypothetical protein